MKKTVLILFAFLLIFSACKSESDSVAEYADGKITRGEFYNGLDARHISRDSILKKKSKQKLRLRQMALEKFTVEEARKAGAEKNPEYTELIGMAKGNFIASFYRRKLQKNEDFNEDAAKVKMIKFRVKDYTIVNNKRKKLPAKDLESSFQEQIKKAQEVLVKLKAGEDFGDLAEKYSHDYSRKKKGDIGYIIRGMKDPAFTDKVFSLKEGEYTSEPVRINNSVYLLKVDKREKLTQDNIDDVIENESKSKRIERRLQMNALKNLEDSLRKSSDVKNNIEKSLFRNASEKLFEYGDSFYTVGDFNRVIAFISKKRSHHGAGMKPLSLDQKRKLADKIFRDKLYEREALKNNILKDSDYLNEWNRYADFSLAGVYKDSLLKDGVKISEDEIKEEYYKLKNRNRKNSKRSPALKPYSQMRDSISKRIENRKKSLERKNWESGLMKKKKFVIMDDALDGE